MEENNYRDEFELFLKESADEFKMVPSRRVWYSLYNNLHPDKKWPSMAVCLFILTAVLYIGIANNNSLSDAAKRASSQNFSYSSNEKNIDNNITFSAKDYTTQKTTYSPKFSLVKTSEDVDLVSNVNDQNVTIDAIPGAKELDGSTLNIPEQSSPTVNSTSVIQSEINNVLKNISDKKKVTRAFVSEELSEKASIINTVETGEFNNNKPVLEITANELAVQKAELLNIEKSWKEDYAFRNKPAINLFKKNASLSYYVTPSLGYRILSKLNQSKVSTASFAAARSNNDETVYLNNAALNLEVGAILQYNISKSLRLKAGVQANYTNYISKVTALGHPLQTSVTLNNNSNNIRSSNFSAKAGKDRINKTTVQVSLPLGADIKIAGNEKIGWYAGGTFQPTYVLGGSAYIFSEDEKYYISDNNLLRKFNLNTSIESFISFKAANGIVLNVGPQFRYQLLSTYKKAYGYKENLYNVGVKVGVTTSF